MSKKNTLIISVIIFVFTIVVVGIFGVVPLPEYSNSISKEIDGKIYYQSSIISSNIIPPAPDLLDDCIFEIEINSSDIIEKEVLCSSDLLAYSTNFYFYDTTVNNEGNLVVRYWNDSSSSEYALEINPENKEILKEYEVENVAIRNQNLNEFSEVLIDSWRTVENTDRSVYIYFQKGSVLKYQLMRILEFLLLLTISQYKIWIRTNITSKVILEDLTYVINSLTFLI